MEPEEDCELLDAAFVLLDMDGTLTEHNQTIRPRVIRVLEEICRHCCIGIITGSTFECMKFQLDPILSGGGGSSLLLDSLEFFPCNGTQHYVFDRSSGSFNKVSETDMLKNLGSKNLTRIFCKLSELQEHFCRTYVGDHNLCLTGDFIQYRGSMINWCPIGRNSTIDQRKKFIETDKEERVRILYREEIIKFFADSDLSSKVSVVFGGQTSFDIYPFNWDKTYQVSRELKGCTLWFVGDQCGPGGNDRTLYNHLNPSERSFSTSGPKETIRILKNKILPKISV